MLKRKKAGLILSGYGMLTLIPNLATLKSEPVYIVKSSANAAVNKASVLTGVPYEAFINDTLVNVDSSEAKMLVAPSIQWNHHAKKAIKDVLKREKEVLDLTSKRSASYFKTIEKIFKQYDLPVQLKYLAVVESQLRSKAVSKVGAKGVWQFMPMTARELGLKVKGNTDERTHFYKSTIAAAKYLKDLYKSFDDWLLVVAAYNSGPGPVYTAIKKSGSRNFWALQRYLPAESRAHVKRYIATHYYFEKEGSITILTKAETKNFNKAMEEFLAALDAKGREKQELDEVATLSN